MFRFVTWKPSVAVSVSSVGGGVVTDQIAHNDPAAPAMRVIQMFDTAWIGVPVTILGLAFLMFCGKWLLPGEKSAEEDRFHGKRLYEAEFEIESVGHLVGRTLREAGFIDRGGCNLLAMADKFDRSLPIKPDYRMSGGEVLTFSCDIDHLPDLWATIGLVPAHHRGKMKSARYTHRLVEAVIAPSSGAIGRKISELPLPRSPYRVWVVAISRGGQPISEHILETRVQGDDDVVMEVDDAFFHEHLNEKEFLIV